MSIIRPGLIAWADPAIGHRVPKARPALILKAFENGNVLIAYVSRSVDLYRCTCPLTEAMAPAAFRADGPMQHEVGEIGLVLCNGDSATVIAEPCWPRLRVGTAYCVLSRQVQLPDDQWQRVRKAILDHTP